MTKKNNHGSINAALNSIKYCPMNPDLDGLDPANYPAATPDEMMDALQTISDAAFIFEFDECGLGAKMRLWEAALAQSGTVNK